MSYPDFENESGRSRSAWWVRPVLVLAIAAAIVAGCVVLAWRVIG